jgi:hypothetical protein
LQASPGKHIIMFFGFGKEWRDILWT